MHHVERGFFRDWLAASIVALAVLTSPASAQTSAAATRVDLQLVLAVDASGSVNQARFELQRAGYAAAFRDQAVVQSIRAGTFKSIAVTMLQWTGPGQQTIVLPWTIVRDDESAERVARAIESAPRQLFGGGTSISGAIDFSVAQFALSPWKGGRQVIDISGDGANNGGRRAHLARDEAISKNIVINGLPILAVEPFLDDHYRHEVIGGDGAFLIAVQSFEEFPAAVRRKLVLEISSAPSWSDFADARLGRKTLR